VRGNGVAREGVGVAKQTPLRRLAPLFPSNIFSVGERGILSWEEK
jgi:hypothetical protein